MLTPADDYPLHQTPEPLAFAGSDRNFYDRFFFNGYSASGDVFFAVALGVYPQLNIMDASVCLLVGGRQHNLRSSKEMQGDRLNLQLGPIKVEIVVPLHQTRITIADNEYGLTGTLTATARHDAIEEPRFTRRNGTRLFMDYTRATQNISWQGGFALNGQEITVDGCLGTRDRSWGLRPVGTADPQANVPPSEPQFYWLWTPVNFADACVFAHSNDDAMGDAWNRRAVVDLLKAGSCTAYETVDFAPSYEADTRRISALHVALGGGAQARFTPQATRFYMQGLGYTHSEWGHGCHHGAERIAYDVIEAEKAEDELKAGQMQNLHIQQLCKVVLEHEGKVFEGQGVIEQMFIGAHAPSGFEGLLDRITG